MCARGLSAIQLPRDTRWQRTPEFASASAVVDPVGPAPMISTSVSYAMSAIPLLPLRLLATFAPNAPRVLILTRFLDANRVHFAGKRYGARCPLAVRPSSP